MNFDMSGICWVVSSIIARIVSLPILLEKLAKKLLRVFESASTILSRICLRDCPGR
jgi:hypothetical protein